MATGKVNRELTYARPFERMGPSGRYFTQSSSRNKVS